MAHSPTAAAEPQRADSARRHRLRVVLAFATIYLVWGSTYLAIRIGVHAEPPFVFAGARFLTAGLILLAWALARKTPLPSGREWRGLALLAALIFVCDYGMLFWAEQRVPSGIAAVMMATIPIFTVLLEIVFLGTQRLTLRLAAGFLVGFAGVAVVVSRNLYTSAPGGAGNGDWRGYAALLMAAMSWSIASILARKVALPASKTMASAAQMVAGGTMLLIVAAALGEYSAVNVRAVSWQVWVAMAYLIFVGSIAAFTAYVWLIHHQSPSRVGTYAYVNPVVAVILGSALGAEAIGARTMTGMLLVLISVVMITTMRTARQPAAGSRTKEAQEPQAAEP